MTVQRIIKMEFYKFFHEKAYLWTFGAMALINIVWLLMVLNIDALGGSQNLQLFLILSFLAIVIVNGVLLYWYPFHILSIDYNNNVLALMMASGIKRSRLFYAKLIATICLSIMAWLVLLLIPILILVFRLNTASGLMSSLMAGITKGETGSFIFNIALSYLTSVTLMLLACTWMRGAKRAILVFIGLSWVYGIVSTMINTQISAVIANQTGRYVGGYLVEVIAIILFSYITQRMMAKQNL